MATELVKSYGLYSPVYEFTTRNGCWFCPNCRKSEWAQLIERHPELFNKLLDLEKEENIIVKKLTRDRTPSQIQSWVKYL